MFHLEYSGKANGETLHSSWDEVGGGKSLVLFDVGKSLIAGLQNQGI